MDLLSPAKLWYRGLFFLLFLFLNIIPRGGIDCSKDLLINFCFRQHGFPFESFFVSGDLDAIPPSKWQEIIQVGFVGVLGNLIVVILAYFIISVGIIYYSKGKDK